MRGNVSYGFNDGSGSNESGVEVQDHVDTLSAVVGSREEVLKRKLVSFVCCFKSPLTYGDTNCDVLFECSRLGLPLLIETGPISGATAPVTLAGLLIQQNTELLFANTLAQLVSLEHRFFILTHRRLWI